MPTYSPSASEPGTAVNDVWSVHEGKGDKEDIADLIGLISPYDTPNYSQFRTTNAIQPVVQWQEDELRAPAANQKVEGFTAAITKGSVTGMRLNYCQLFSETAQVSGTALSTEFYGRANELDYQVMKRGLEVRRDIEYALCGGGAENAAPAAGDKDTARAMGGIQSLIGASTTLDNSGAGDALRAFTEDLVLAAHEACYVLGGNPNQLQVTPQHAISVANFAYASGRERDFGSERRIVNVVDLYVSPYGEMSVVTNKWLKGPTVGSPETANNGSHALLLETDRWWMPVLRPMTTEPLAKTGDNETRMITCELTVAHENRDASAQIQDLVSAFTPA